MTTFVLVHGAWLGGWVWRDVARRLHSEGHEVFTPTLTGCGERRHLASQHINLSTHVADVEAVIQCEGLDDIVLVGHSYGGGVVSVVADRNADKISTLVNLDGFILRDGESTWGFNGPKHEKFIESAARTGGYVAPITPEEFNVLPENIPMVSARIQDMPLGCFIEQANLSGAGDQIEDRRYVFCDGWKPTPFARMKERAETSSGWDVSSVDSGHHWMIDAPDDCADYLRKCA